MVRETSGAAGETEIALEAGKGKTTGKTRIVPEAGKDDIARETETVPGVETGIGTGIGIGETARKIEIAPEAETGETASGHVPGAETERVGRRTMSEMTRGETGKVRVQAQAREKRDRVKRAETGTEAERTRGPTELVPKMGAITPHKSREPSALRSGVRTSISFRANTMLQDPRVRDSIHRAPQHRNSPRRSPTFFLANFQNKALLRFDHPSA